MEENKPNACNTTDVVCKRCGSVNDYKAVVSGPHLKAICNPCNIYIKFIPQGKEFILPFGKFKGRALDSLETEEELNSIVWILQKMSLKQNMITKLETFLVSKGIDWKGVKI